MKGMQRRKTTIIVLVTVLAILLSSTVLFSVVPGNSADALTTAQVSSAVKAGGGADLWNSATSTWNATVLSDMVSKIFPVTTTWESYIKNNGSEDYTRVGKNSPNVAEKDIPYYVVPASTINARVGSANYGMVVKLDGKDWMVTSLTIDRDDNIVVTLMLATPNDSAVGTTKYWGTAGETKGNNMYARSLVRSKLLSSSYFSLFSTAGAGSFAEKYLVQPKNIQYQRTETQYNRAKSGEVPENVNGNIPNDALGSLTSGWDDKTYKVNYQPSDTFPDASGNMVRYDAWGDDYIWLPSVTETGNNGSIPTSCIWKLTSYQRSHSSSTAFTRSGDANGWQNVYPLTSTGAHGGDSCTSTGSVRPAIHLNLSAIAKVTPITSDIYKAGGGEDMWDDGTFNDAVVDDITSKIFGNTDPVDYIKANGAGDYNTYGKNSPCAEKDIPYWVVPASTINNKIGYPDWGMLVQLGGFYWMVASLTLDTSGNVILTLWMANPADNVSTKYYTNGNNTKGNNMYSRSVVRNQLLTRSNLSLFSTTGEGSFAEQFLVQPKNIQYQRTETQYGRPNGENTSNNCINDALLDLTAGWYAASIKCSPGDSYADPTGKSVRYDAWGEDYIWLPSVTETSNNSRTGSAPIWGVTSKMRTFDGAYPAFLRSGDTDGHQNVYPHLQNGNHGGDINTNPGLIRPAIHLNLTAVIESMSVSVGNPTDMTSVYNSDIQSVKSIYDANPTSYTWYKKDIYENTSGYIKLTADREIKNAGTYWIKAEVTPAWKAAVDAQVDADGAKRGWTAQKIAEVKAKRSPRFKGDPVTEEGHVESDTVRWFKIVIDPKELAVNKPSFDTTTMQYTPPTFATGATSGFSDVPVLATRYTGTSADGTAFDQIDEMPNKRGTYTATAILVNSLTDKTEYSGGNFTIKDASSMTCSIQVNRARLTIPVSAEPSKTYTGSDVKFILPRAYNNDWREIGLLVLPDDGSLKLEGNDTEGWYLVARDAGTYSVTAAIKSDKKSDWCWNTDDGLEVTDDRVITVTITKATLFVDFTSTTGAFLMQKNSNVTFGVGAANVIDGDDVHVSLQYYNAEYPDVPIPVPSGSLNAAALDQGKYRLEAYLEDDLAADNKNYALDATSSYQDFTISAQGINLPTVGWQYRENGGLATPIAGGDTSDAPFKVTYTGGTFEFTLAMNTATLANSGVKIDGTYGVNGYQNNTQVNATENAVAVSVKLIPYSAEFAFNDEHGQQAEEQFKVYTLYVKVDKATIDFSKVVWSADELEYSAFGNSVEVLSGIPSFLNITYNDGAKGLTVGDYKAEVRSLQIKNNAKDIATAANYIVPSLVDVRASEYLKHDWKIVKKRINVTWVPVEESVESSIVWIPYILDNSTNVIEYSYYLDSDDAMANKLTLDDIMNDFDATKTVDYLVCATVNNDNFVLFEAGKEVEYSLSAFQVGDNKIPVRVNLKTDSVVYNGTKQEAEVEVDAGGIKINVIITYLVKEGDTFVPLTDPDQPMDAAEYKVRVALTPDISESMAISGQREFLYTIEKAEIDLSDLKWVDAANGDEEYTEPYVYKPGVTHELTLSGVDAISELGLSVTYTADTQANRTGTNAGDYKVVITFTESEFFESNYKVPDDIEFTWQILPYTPDLSGVTWNYNADPFIFKIKDGEPVKQSARLIGFPEGYEEELASMIVYGDDDGEYSDVSTHRTSYGVNEDHEKRSNYGAFLFPSGLETAIDWEIHPLKVEKAPQQQTKPFVGEGYSFEEITNLPEDFNEYFDVAVLDASNQNVEQTDGTWRFINVGKYRIQIRFKSGMNKSNGGKVDNVKWSDNSRSAYQVTLTIEKLVLNADGWIDGEGTDVPTLDSEDLDEIEKYFDYVLKTQAGEVIDIDTPLEEGKYYTIALKVKPEYAGNVFINYKGQEVSETAPYAFQTKEEFFEPTDFIPMPSDEDLTIKYKYTGEEITFELGDWYDEDKMTIVSGEMKGTEIGEYHVVVGFNEFANTVAWGTEEKWSRNPVTVTFIITAEENTEKGRFVLIDAMKDNHPYKFQYEDYKVYDKDISEYVYSESDVVYMARLAFNDTLADLLAQFKNGNEIKVFDAKDVEITNMSQVLATGMVLRLMDGTTVLNQLTISVLGDIDGDGKIGTLDKAQLNAFTLGTRKLDGAKLLASDIDGDGKIGTLDKAQLNAYTLGTRDLYSKLTLKSSAKSASVASLESEEVVVNSEEVMSEVTVEDESVAEITDIAVETSEEAIANEITANSEKVWNDTFALAEKIICATIKEMPKMNLLRK